jgi:long-chain acyl-CoA synthetase
MNVVDTIRDFAREHPDHLAVVAATPEGNCEISYAALIGRIDRIARALIVHGVGRAERVGVMAPQTPQFIETALAVISIGACVVPIPADTRGATLDEFCDRAYLHRVVTPADGRETEPTIADAPQRTRLAAEVEAGFAALAPAYLRFTSGTTNLRKGVVLGHERIVQRLDAANAALNIGPDDRVLWLLPMAHHFVVSILLYLRAGATVLLPASALAGAILEFAERADATVLYASPYHFGMLAGDRSEVTLPHLRLAVSTAEQLRRATADAFRERFAQPVVQALGIIEVGLPVVNLPSAATKPEALGRPLDDYDVWLRDDNGDRIDESSPERTGEICIRGPGLFDAYLDPWTPSASMIDGLRTGDQGWFDSDGDLHLAGRRTNRINMAGMKFFCEEVERVLDAHPAVVRSLVYARDHARLGEIPVADVVVEGAVDQHIAKSLAAHCRERLAPYMVPREFRVVDALPQTATGKIARTRPSRHYA